MGYSGSQINTGRVGEDTKRIKDNWDRIFGNKEQTLPISPMDRELVEGEVEDV